MHGGARRRLRVRALERGHTSPCLTWDLVFLCRAFAQSRLMGQNNICIIPLVGSANSDPGSPIRQSKLRFIPITSETPESHKISDSFYSEFPLVCFHSYHCTLSCEKKSTYCFTDGETKAQISEEVQPGSQAEVRLKCSTVTSGQFGLELVWFPGRVLKL